MLALVSNINIDPIEKFFENVEVAKIGYGQYGTSLADRTSVLYREQVKEVLFFIDGDEWIKPGLFCLPTSEIEGNVLRETERLLSLISNYLSARPDIVFVVTTMALSPEKFTTFLETNSPYSFGEIEFAINRLIKKLATLFPNLLVLEWRDIMAQYGYNNLVDVKYWYLARVKLNNRALRILHRQYNQLLAAYYGKIKKVLVLDLDNTLWGGIIGEDGVSGIQLSEDGIGKAYRDFQMNIKAVKQVGVLLAINSKNNLDDVRDVFVRHSMMVLKRDDFVVEKINWQNKVSNLKEMANELNLGLDSFVFIDDNAVERELVKNNLPEVSVPEFPKDVAYLSEWFLHDVVPIYFPKVNLTEEDIHKTEQYKAAFTRREFLQQSNVEDVIQTLHIKLFVYLNPRRYLSRLAQMTQKTNQFNMTTKRYTEKDIDIFLSSGESLVFAMEYEDKFGKEGIVGEAIVKIANRNAILDSFLMSCRIIGKKVEYTFLYEILKYLSKHEIETVCAEFLPTAKNVVARDFYANAGLQWSQSEYRGQVPMLLNYLSQKVLLGNVTNDYD